LISIATREGRSSRATLIIFCTLDGTDRLPARVYWKNAPPLVNVSAHGSSTPVSGRLHGDDAFRRRARERVELHYWLLVGGRHADEPMVSAAIP
jgi:hypothetical protein